MLSTLSPSLFALPLQRQGYCSSHCRQGSIFVELPVLPARCRGAIPSSPTQVCNLWGRLDRTDNLGAAITHLWGRRHRDPIGSSSNKDRERHVGASRDGAWELLRFDGSRAAKCREDKRKYGGLIRSLVDAGATVRNPKRPRCCCGRCKGHFTTS